MAALTADRSTVSRDAVQFEFPVAASTKIYAGALVGVGTATTYAAPMTAATTWKCVGVAQELADNSAGANGAINVKVQRGCFRFVNGESITRASLGATAYANDDNTVYTTSTGRSAVGVIRDVDASGVWVEI